MIVKIIVLFISREWEIRKKTGHGELNWTYLPFNTTMPGALVATH